MKKLFPSVLFLFVLSLTSFAQTTQPTATPTPKRVEPNEEVVKISTTLIQVDVTVTDKNGKIVTDLKPEDFEVYENGEKQNITNFSFVTAAPTSTPTPAPAPKNTDKNAIPAPPPPTTLRPEQVRRTISLVVDDLTISFENIHFVRQALKKYVDKQMQDGDLVAIIRTGAGIGALQQFTSDKRQLYAAIEKIRWNPLGRGRLTAFEPLQAKLPSSTQEDTSEQATTGVRDSDQEAENFRQSVYSTGTLGALKYVITGMKELPGRKSVMLFSEGFRLFTNGPAGKESDFRLQAVLESLVDLANRASVVVYTMDVRGLEPGGITAADNTSTYSPTELQEKANERLEELSDTQDGLVYLARQTGGLPVINNNDFNQGIDKMLNDQKGYYLLGYAPDSDTFDAKTRRFNKLSVKLKRPDLKIRYRSGFFGITDDEAVRPVKQTATQQITTALTSPFASNDINLHLNALFGNDAKNGAYMRSLLHVDAKDLKFTDEADGSHKATFDVLAVSFGDNGTVTDQLAKNYTLTLKNEVYEQFLREGFVYNFVFPVKKPGAYQLRVAIRDAGSQKVGSANQFIEVPNIKKNGLTLSGMVLENLSVKQFQDMQSNAVAKETSSDARADLQADTSLRIFKRGTVLRYGFEIYNAKLDSSQKPQLMTQTRVFRDGKMLFDGKQNPMTILEQKDPQRAATTGALSLGKELLPGDYVLQIIVTDSLAKGKRKIATQYVQFEITE